MGAISNNEIKRLKSLQQKKVRDDLGVFVVEGEKMVREAVSSPFEVECIYRKDEIGEEAMRRIHSTWQLMSYTTFIWAISKKTSTIMTYFGTPITLIPSPSKA